MAFSLPNLLTFSRLLLIPFIVGAFYLPASFSHQVAGTLFVGACITDYLDGYFARTLKTTSRLGQFLDPLADKLLIATTLLMLAGFGEITGLSLIPAAIILCREILVSGLREFLFVSEILLPVKQASKWKTMIQMLSLSFLLFGTETGILDWLGGMGLWIAALLTLYTGYDYLKSSASGYLEKDSGK